MFDVVNNSRTLPSLPASACLGLGSFGGALPLTTILQNQPASVGFLPAWKGIYCVAPQDALGRLGFGPHLEFFRRAGCADAASSD